MFEISTLKEALALPKQIVITTHYKPDGDAMGSSLGLYHYLVQKGHKVKVITPSDYPMFLHWLPGNAEVVIYTEKPELSQQLVADADLIFCLDFNTLTRIETLGEHVRQAAAPKVMIDHHPEPEGFDHYRYWSTSACATAQLVFQLINNVFQEGQLIDKHVATCLYTGIVTDSGSFRFPSTTAVVHEIAAELIRCGAENGKIHQLLYNNFSENRLRFLGHCLLHRLEVLPEFNTALIAVRKEDLEQYHIAVGDTEGLVNYALSISGIHLAVLIVDRHDRVKLSLRSVGEFPVNEICKKYFNGGGHRNAAGGSSEYPLEQVVQRLKEILPSYKPLLVQ